MSSTRKKSAKLSIWKSSVREKKEPQKQYPMLLCHLLRVTKYDKMFPNGARNKAVNLFMSLIKNPKELSFRRRSEGRERAIRRHVLLLGRRARAESVIIKRRLSKRNDGVNGESVQERRCSNRQAAQKQNMKRTRVCRKHISFFNNVWLQHKHPPCCSLNYTCTKIHI